MKYHISALLSLLIISTNSYAINIFERLNKEIEKVQKDVKEETTNQSQASAPIQSQPPTQATQDAFNNLLTEIEDLISKSSPGNMTFGDTGVAIDKLISNYISGNCTARLPDMLKRPLKAIIRISYSKTGESIDHFVREAKIYPNEKASCNGKSMDVIASTTIGKANAYLKLQSEKIASAEAEKKQKLADTKVTAISDFKTKWCKDIDSKASGGIEVRELRTGDLCQAPDDVFKSITESLVNRDQPLKTFENANVSLPSGHISNIYLVVDNKNKKIYVNGFTYYICATDILNNLEIGNKFRSALEQKYGSPIKSWAFDEKNADLLKTRERQLNNMERNIATSSDAMKSRQARDQYDTATELIKKSGADKDVVQLGWGLIGNNQPNTADSYQLLVEEISIYQSPYPYGFKCSLSKAYTFTATGNNYIKQIANNLFSAEKNKIENPKF